MFTGIVETIGGIKSLAEANQVKTLVIDAPAIMDDVKVDDSIAVNGVCLTVVEHDQTSFTVQAVPETLRRTNLGLLEKGSSVNVERAMLPTTRIGGHFVQGHVDGVAQIRKIEQEGAAKLIYFECSVGAEQCLRPLNSVKHSRPKRILQSNISEIAFSDAPCIINKGFITVDGMSLTVIESTKEGFNLTLIPHTQAVTIASDYQVGDVVNVEFDILGKYISRRGFA